MMCRITEHHILCVQIFTLRYMILKWSFRVSMDNVDFYRKSYKCNWNRFCIFESSCFVVHDGGPNICANSHLESARAKRLDVTICICKILCFRDPPLKLSGFEHVSPKFQIWNIYRWDVRSLVFIFEIRGFTQFS